VKGWIVYGAVFAVFLASHSIPVRPNIKSRLIAKLGRGGFSFAYSVLSTVMLACLITAATQAPFVGVWDNAIWQRHLALAGMFVVCVVLALSIGRPNPFSFGGANNDRFDPARPGIVRWTRHPVLFALALWSGLHLLANGDLAHVVLFAIFTLFAVMGHSIIDRRTRRHMGDKAWRDIQNAVKQAPLFQRPHSFSWLAIRLLAAGFAYATLIHLHETLLGVSPLP